MTTLIKFADQSPEATSQDTSGATISGTPEHTVWVHFKALTTVSALAFGKALQVCFTARKMIRSSIATSLRAKRAFAQTTAKTSLSKQAMGSSWTTAFSRFGP